MAIPRPELAPNKKRLTDKMLDDLAARRTRDSALSKPPAKSETNVPLGKAVGDVARTNPAALKDISPAKESPRGQVPDRASNESDLDYLARLRAEQGKVRDATESELAAGKAKAQQDAASRAGAAGMGLSGASAALQSDIGRQQDRSAVLALNDLDQRQNNEEFDAIQREGAIMDYEDAYDVDMDMDGLINGVAVDIDAGIGDGDPDNNPEGEARGTDIPKQAAEDLKKKNDATLDSWDYLMGDADTDPGTKEEPYVFEGNIQDLRGYLRGTGAWPLDQVEVGGLTLFRDKHGNYYYLDRG